MLQRVSVNYKVWIQILRTVQAKLALKICYDELEVLFSLSLDESSSPFLTILSPEEPSELSSDVAEDSGLMDLLIAVAGMAALLLGEITLCTLTSIGLLSSTKLDGLDALEPKKNRKKQVRTTLKTYEYSKHYKISHLNICPDSIS
jgi:hypothetical protein